MIRATAVLWVGLLAVACSSPDLKYTDEPDGSAGTGQQDGGGGTAGSGGSAGGENCLNGVDDDDNGLIDCQDPGCKAQGYQCVPTPVAPWVGPVVLTAQASGLADPEPCPSGYSEDLLVGKLTAGATTCQTCQCGTLQGKCDKPTFKYWTVAACTGTPSSTTMFPSACQQWNISGGGAQAFGFDPPAATGSCPAVNVGSPVIPSPELTNRRRVCKAAPGACSAGDCAPPAPSGAQICILGPVGDDSSQCPPEYPQASSFDTAQAPDDSRDCELCGCTLNATCAGTVIDIRASCSQTTVFGTLNDANPCKLQNMSSFGAALKTAPELKGACTPTGGTPIGALAPKRVKVCCLAAS